MNAMIRRVAALLAAALLASTGAGIAHAAIIRVPGDFAFLENAVDAAAPGDTVQVAGNGGATYRSRFIITRPILLQGGWRADFQVRNPSIYVSVIRSPQDAFEFDRPVIQVQFTSGVVIEGFTIVRGRVGIDASGSNVVIRDCEVQSQRNQVGGIPGFNRAGGCIRIGGGTATIERVSLHDAFCDFGGTALAVVAGGQAAVTDSRMENHLSIGAGGACVLVDNSSSLTLERTEVARGATVADGGLVFARNSSLVAVDCTFLQGSASVNGGAIAATGCPTVRLTGCTIDECNANSRGGGLDIQNCGSLTLEGCMIERNSTKIEGGGIRILETPFTISDCRFASNHRLAFPVSVSTRGGGIRAQSSSGSVSRTCFVDERANGLGGAFAQVGGDVDFDECVIDGGTAVLYGGGFYIELAGTARFTNSLFRGCQAKFGGAIGASFTGHVELEHCTLTENEASTTGGALYVETGATATVASSILCRAPRGDLVSCSSGSATFTSCDVWNDDLVNTRTEFTGGCSDPAGANGNIRFDPLFCALPGPPPFCDAGALAFTLDPVSPCAGQGVGGSDMGWRGVGCPFAPLLHIEEDTWGRIKSRYRTR